MISTKRVEGFMDETCKKWLEAERIVLARHKQGTKKEKPIRSSKATTKKGK